MTPKRNGMSLAAVQQASQAALDAYRDRAEVALVAALERLPELSQRLIDAMRYSLLGSGKRIRPQLVYAAGHAVGIPAHELDSCASAVECIHAYSLIHDDLPAMDDDDMRRGRPSCHKAFDEATAILAGDALQALAFSVLVDQSPNHDDRIWPTAVARRVALLAEAAGAPGMVAGQMIDLAAVGRTLNQAELETMHAHKTGALIRASVLLPACAKASLSEHQWRMLEAYGESIGLAFQVRDDVLDVIGDTATLGKQTGADYAHDKPTFAGLLGVDGARDYADALCEKALTAAADFGPNGDRLAAIANYIVGRNH